MVGHDVASLNINRVEAIVVDENYRSNWHCYAIKTSTKDNGQEEMTGPALYPDQLAPVNKRPTGYEEMATI